MKKVIAAGLCALLATGLLFVRAPSCYVSISLIDAPLFLSHISPMFSYFSFVRFFFTVCILLCFLLF